MDLLFYVFVSTGFQSNKDEGRITIKGSVRKGNLCSGRISSSRPCNYEFRVLSTQYREASFIGRTVCIDMQAMLGTWRKVPIARPVNVRR